MRILRVIGSANPVCGGPVEGMLQSATVLSRLGHSTEIVTLDDPDSLWLQDYPFPIVAVGTKAKFYAYSPRLLHWLRGNWSRFDVVIQHGLWNYTAYATGRALSGTSIPYFVFAHGMLDPWFRSAYPLKHLGKQFFWWFSEGPLLRGARTVFFTSEEERIRSRDAFLPYKLDERVVAYGTADVGGNRACQIAAFRSALPALEARRFLLFLGRIHPKKGCDLLIRAFARVAPLHPDLDLVIAGPDQIGWRRDLEAIANSIGISNRVHWPGMLTGDAKWGTYRACEAFVLPSHQENFGIVVAEAMACGRPVLITDKVNIWREVVESGAGLVATDDQHGIDALLFDFLSPKCNAAQMSDAARRTFLQKFEIESTARSLLEAITEKGR